MRFEDTHDVAIDWAVSMFNVHNHLNLNLDVGPVTASPGNRREITWTTMPRGLDRSVEREILKTSPYEKDSHVLILRALGCVVNSVPSEGDDPVKWAEDVTRRAFNTGPEGNDDLSEVSSLLEKRYKRVIPRERYARVFSNALFIFDVLYCFLPTHPWAVRSSMHSAIRDFKFCRGEAKTPATREAAILVSNLERNLEYFSSDVASNVNTLASLLPPTKTRNLVLSSALNRHTYGPPRTTSDGVRAVTGSRVYRGVDWEGVVSQLINDFNSYRK